jgi:autotransporter-associated beta strand protein
LLAWTSGSAPQVSLGTVNGALGSLTTNGNTIQFNVAPTFVWSGSNNGRWDTTTPGNWLQNGSPVVFTNGGPAVFDDTAPGTTAVTVGALVQPVTLTVFNSAPTYSIASSGGNNIAGATGLAKGGTGALTLSGGANTYTGATRINGGTLSVGALANGGLPSDLGSGNSGAANLALDGGTLRYTGGGASLDRLFALGASGGTIDGSGSGALNLTNSGPLGYSGIGPRALTLTGANTNGNTLAGALADNGGPTSLIKSGAGNWILAGANTYSGATTIAAGILQVGSGGASGTLGTGNITNNGALILNRSDTLTLLKPISGTGWLAAAGPGTLTLTATNPYSGNTYVFDGSLIVNGSNPASYTIASGGTLGGTGVLWGVSLQAGATLAPGAANGAIGTLTATASLWIEGNLAIEVDKSLGQSNDFVVADGQLVNAGTGTVLVTNLGPALVPGDRFQLFSQPLQGGGAMTVAGAGVPWVNHLGFDGSIIVGPVLPPGTLGLTNLGDSVKFYWIGNFKLQAQTNSLLAGLRSNWFDYPGGDTSPITVPIAPANRAVFFKLAALPASIDLTSGTSGAFVTGQSYNHETRAMDVTVVSPYSLAVNSMTLSGIGSDGEVEAVIYVSGSQVLMASAGGYLTGGTVTLPISATLTPGGQYRIGFYVGSGSGTFFQPDSFPYWESSGLLRINSAWDYPANSFPTTTNRYVPQVRLNVTPRL